MFREVYEEMEQGLEILGATAIEDKLQVEFLLTPSSGHFRK